jgi:hypothetical protein
METKVHTLLLTPCVDHMLIHYKKSSAWKLHYLVIKNSYNTTMQLDYTYLLKNDDFYSISNIIWVLL